MRFHFSLLTALSVLLNSPISANSELLQNTNKHRHHRRRHRKELSLLNNNNVEDNLLDELMRQNFINTPCQIPPISSERFPAVCTQYLHKPYICSRGTAFSQTEAEKLESLIQGKYSFCNYDRILELTQAYPLGDEAVIAREAAAIQKERDFERIRKHQNTQGHPPGTKPRRPKLDQLLRPLNRRANIAITIFSDYQQIDMDLGRSKIRSDEIFSKLASICPEITFSKGKMPVEMRLPAAAEFVNQRFADVSRNIFTEGNCETDISVLVLGFVSRNGMDMARVPTIHVSLSEKFEKILGNETRNLAEKISVQEIFQPGQKLISFIRQMTKIMEVKYTANPEKKYHRIPNWAVAVFAVCIVLSFVAVILGSLVNNNNKGRSSSTGPGKPRTNRKWKAGFSGGMWGAA